MKFRENLNTMNAEEIRAILRGLGEKKLPSRKGDLIDRLQGIWIDEPQRLIDLLSEPERLLLAECVQKGNYSPNIDQLNSKYGFNYSMPSHGSYGGGQVIHCFLSYARYYGYELLTDVEDRLERLLPAPADLQIESLEDLPDTAVWSFPRWSGENDVVERPMRVYESERIAPMECRRMLQMAGAGTLRVSDKTGNPTAATVRKVGEALCAPDMDIALPKDCADRPWDERDVDPGTVRAFAWPVLLQQCGWAKPKGGKLQLTKAGKTLRDDFSFERYAEGVSCLISRSTRDELRRVKVIKGQNGRRVARGRRDPCDRKLAIKACLCALPRGEWVSLEEANRAIYALDEDGRAYAEATFIYLAEMQYGQLHGYEKEIGRIYFRQLLGDALATLGIVDVGYTWPHYIQPELGDAWGIDDECFCSVYDGIKYLRVTPLGRYCLGIDSQYEPPETQDQSLFKVLPNLDIVVVDSASFSVADEAVLDRFAKRKSDLVWKMDKKSMISALEAGESADDTLAVLRNFSQNEIPDNVVKFIRDVAERAEAVKSCRDAVVVDFIDEATAQLVEGDTTAAKSVIAREGKSVVVLKSKVKGFKTALRKMGIVLKL